MAQDGSGLSVRFWGVRGSIPAPGIETLRYGGDTTCIEIRAEGRLFVIDSGSGARRLGLHMQEIGEAEADLFYTHFHFDHICGLPFFCPAMNPDFSIRCWAGHYETSGEFVAAIENLMSPPIFPVDTSVLAGCSFQVFERGKDMVFGNSVRLRTIPLNHPGGATGYRFEFGDKSVSIITDHEHGDAAIDSAVLDFVEGTDIMVYDAMFDDAKYEKHVGWGHSTWQKCLEIATAANVKLPIVFHHDHMVDDDGLDAIGRQVEERFPGALVAREGLELTA